MARTLKANRVYEVAQQWPGISKIGDQRAPGDIAKSDRLSEHTWGNALDIFGSREGLATLAEYLNDRRQEFDIATLCYDPGPGRKYDRCTTKHTDHIHVSFAPKCYKGASASGSGVQRAKACDEYQGTGTVTTDEKPGFWDRAFGDQHKPFQGTLQESAAGTVFGPLVNAVERIATTGLFVGLGAALAGAGIYLAVKDTEAFKAVQGAAKTYVTKGAA